MKKNQKGFSVVEGLLIVIILGLIGFGGWLVVHKHSVNKTAATSNSSAVVTFSGKITQINNGCSVDAACSITVDGKSVKTGGGLSPNAAENIYGNRGPNGGNANLKMGQTVSVKAVKSGDGYTLQACPDCYIR